MNRVWVSNGSGLLEEPVSLPVARSGIAALERMLAEHAGEQLIAIEATGGPHRAWAVELERLDPGSLRLFAPPKPRPPVRSWDRVASRPTTVIAPR